MQETAKANSGLIVTAPSKKTYLVRTKQYKGQLEDGLIVREGPKSDEKTYLALVFTDVTTIQKVVDRVNLVLLIILFLTLLPLLLIMRKTISGIGESIEAVRQYIARLWRNQDQPKAEAQRVIFSEFDGLLQESHDMANRIKEAEETQCQFFQNASRELRTPLMSIQGYTEGLKEGVIPQEQALPVILSESYKMKQLVDDMIFLSRLDSREKLSQEKLSLSHLVQDFCEYFTPIANQEGLSLICSGLDDGLQIIGNQELLQRAFSNIMTNALRYARKSIKISQSEGQLSISNDGPEISAAELPHIFERFYKGAGGQTGIGLAMTKEILEQHGATIRAESKPHQTTFIIDFTCHKIATTSPQTFGE
ncbi:sensor histidine kinase [Streptococcus ictaluri]|uniref:histidine kinase n=1 Tax=Streptococcus ictaluri 707-05 TaxID=764299 RepID=G5K520_9STRE|nr:HAMP domain-containing sensor histidine kinase [Streptococcus ictaluri]EHI69184.1 ATPase/histidine kinase/DNA gyrase B/HSP90 domain protein [Streptococcus ictaluri 707-05]